MTDKAKHDKMIEVIVERLQRLSAENVRKVLVVTTTLLDMQEEREAHEHEA